MSSQSRPPLWSADDVDDGARGDEVVYDFNGFDPGEAYVFRADVDPDTDPSGDLNQLLDFRSILFNNGAPTTLD